jgi:cysteine desulfuration protein SufE
MMQDAASGLTPDEILAIPDGFYLDIGLQEVLSGQRLNGMGAILARVKELARRHGDR